MVSKFVIPQGLPESSLMDDLSLPSMALIPASGGYDELAYSW